MGGVSQNENLPTNVEGHHALDKALKRLKDPVAIAKAGLPHLLKRLILLAHMSKNVNAIAGVVSDLSDRVYGKPSQAVDVKGKIEHVSLVINCDIGQNADDHKQPEIIESVSHRPLLDKS